MARTLLIEDEAGIRMTIGDRLRAEGYQVEAASDGQAGFERAREGIETPLLMLTAKGQLSDRVRGLRIGADDYLVKPFAMLELLARIAAILRRHCIWTGAGDQPAYMFGKVLLDTKQAAVFREGKQLTLSAKEYQLLLYFVQHPRETLSGDVMLREVWHYQADVSTCTVDVHVGWLRQKIEDGPKTPCRIVTRHGLGYLLNPS